MQPLTRLHDVGYKKHSHWPYSTCSSSLHCHTNGPILLRNTWLLLHSLYNLLVTISHRTLEIVLHAGHGSCIFLLSLLSSSLALADLWYFCSNNFAQATRSLPIFVSSFRFWMPEVTGTFGKYEPSLTFATAQLFETTETIWKALNVSLSNTNTVFTQI